MARDFSVLFIGTSSPFATRPLEAISKSYPLAGIVESARRDFNSHSFRQRISFFWEQRLSPHSLWRLAKRARIPYYLYLKADETQFIEFLKSVQADIGVIASMNHLLPARALAIPRCGFINLHPSLLPDLRGPHVWTWLYFDNDRQGGVTISRVDAGEDSGPIFKQESFPIYPGMPPERLIDTSIRLGTRLLMETLYGLYRGEIKAIPQAAPGKLRRAARLKAGEDIFQYRSWDLQRTYHFLQGVRPWYSPFRLKRLSAGILDWRPTGFKPAGVSPDKIGSIRLDWRGVYFSHPQGKIYLVLEIRPLYIFVFLLLVFAMVNIFVGK